MQVTRLEFPRIGRRRSLRAALEGYWQGSPDATALCESAREVSEINELLWRAALAATVKAARTPRGHRGRCGNPTIAHGPGSVWTSRRLRPGMWVRRRCRVRSALCGGSDPVDSAEDPSGARTTIERLDRNE